MGYTAVYCLLPQVDEVESKATASLFAAGSTSSVPSPPARAHMAREPSEASHAKLRRVVCREYLQVSLGVFCNYQIDIHILRFGHQSLHPPSQRQEYGGSYAT